MTISCRSRIVTALAILMLVFPFVGSETLRAAGTPDVDSANAPDVTIPMPLETADADVPSPTATETAPFSENPESSMTPAPGQTSDPLETPQPTDTPGANAGVPFLTVDGFFGDSVFPLYEDSDITVDVSLLATGQEIAIVWSEYACPSSGVSTTRFGPFVADTHGRVSQAANVGRTRLWSIQAQTADGTWSNCVTIETHRRPATPTPTPTGDTDVAFDAYRYTLLEGGTFTATLTIIGRGNVSPRQMVITTDTAWGRLGSSAASASGDRAMQCTLVERDDMVVVQLASTGDGTCTIVSVWMVEMPDPRMFLRQGDLFATEWIDGTPTQRAWSRIVSGSPPAGTPIATDASGGTAPLTDAPVGTADSAVVPAVRELPNTGSRTGPPPPNGVPGAAFWLLGAILLGISAFLTRSTSRRGPDR